MFWLGDCCGLCGPAADDREPLLPQYEDDTTLQRRLHQKLHTYQMLRAMSQGFMPSNEQVIVNLRTLLSADILNPEHEDLSDSGQALCHYTKQWLRLLIELLHNKNGQDQIQDFIWYLSKAKISVDTDDLAHVAVRSKASADTKAGTEPSAMTTKSYFVFVLMVTSVPKLAHGRLPANDKLRLSRLSHRLEDGGQGGPAGHGLHPVCRL